MKGNPLANMPFGNASYRLASLRCCTCTSRYVPSFPPTFILLSAPLNFLVLYSRVSTPVLVLPCNLPVEYTCT